jgi:hypothetical protein
VSEARLDDQQNFGHYFFLLSFVFLENSLFLFFYMS